MRLLARTRYATQAIFAAGLGGDDSHRRARLRALVQAGLVLERGPLGMVGGGRAPSLFRLSRRGAERISPALGRMVRHPEGWPRQEAHALGMARLVVALDKLAAAYGGVLGVVRLASDVRRLDGGGMAPETRLRLEGGGWLIPDALAVVTPRDGRPRPLALEFENGSNQDKAGHVLGKVPMFGQALDESAIGKALGLPDTPARILLVFATDALLRKAWAGWQTVEGDWDSVFMQSIDALDANPLTPWVRIGQEASPLFQSQ